MMKRQTTSRPSTEKFEARVGKLGSDELLEVLDVTVSGLNAYVSLYRKGRDLDALREMNLQVESLYSITQELLRRRTGEDPPAIRPARQTRSF